MNTKPITPSLERDLARAIRTHNYEKGANGLYLPHARATIGGSLKVTDYRRRTDQRQQLMPNLLSTEGLVHILNSAFPPSGGYAQAPNLYIAPYSGDYTPTNGLTAANFAATATEFTTYTPSTTRLGLTIGAAATTASTGNSGAEAIMTFTTGGNIYGAAILTNNVRGGGSGKLVAAVRMDNPRLAMAVADKLGFEYVITAADGG